MGQCVNKTPFKGNKQLMPQRGLQTQEKPTVHSFNKKRDFQTNSNLTIYETNYQSSICFWLNKSRCFLFIKIGNHS
jgi:hypothetical protein